MSAAVVALHGFLGCGQDWDAVRAATKSPIAWHCPDLFAPGKGRFTCPELTGRAWLVGYSFGARLALRWLEAAPERWCGALLLSANPGNFQSDEERASRRRHDARWARDFRTQPWSSLIERWNAQQVLAGSGTSFRCEADFDREKLARALEQFSVADQFTTPSHLPETMVWLAGERDEKFCRLLETMRLTGFPGRFFTLPEAGHRLLVDAPRMVAARLDELLS